jgi:prepilin-type N-terminal cleavage/methylation domain-containing protein/prepilin-type processing-associated H-X9-DG protein
VIWPTKNLLAYETHGSNMVIMKRAGFTLIELLVVMGILSILMAILSSALHATRQQAKTLKCQANIRNLGQGLINYSMENDRFPAGLLFPNKMEIGSLAYDPPAKWWFQLMGQRPKKFDIVHTPLQCPSKHINDSILLKYNLLWGNYGANWSICSASEGVMPNNIHEFARTSLAYERVANPSQVLLLVDSGYSLIGWQHAAKPVQALTPSQGALATSYVPGLSTNKDRELHPVQQADAIEGRHPNKTVNVGYVDGHVEQRKADDLRVEQSAEGHYSNRTPLWKPR